MTINEVGCEHVTVPENTLLEMSILDTMITPPPGRSKIQKVSILSPRLIHLLAVDPLAMSSWDGDQPCRNIDYLANHGAALTEATQAD